MTTRKEIVAAAKEAGVPDNWNAADWYFVSPHPLERFYTIAFEAGAASQAMAIAAKDAEIAELQAHIDELMLEYCPNEMTKEQLEEWGRNQVAVPEDSLPEALAKVRKP